MPPSSSIQIVSFAADAGADAPAVAADQSAAVAAAIVDGHSQLVGSIDCFFSFLRGSGGVFFLFSSVPGLSLYKHVGKSTRKKNPWCKTTKTDQYDFM